MKTILCTLLCFVVQNSFAQQRTIDSLQELLPTANTSTEKATLYYNLAFASIEINPTKALEYSLQAQALVGKDNLELKGKIYQVTGLSNIYLGQNAQAEILLDSAFEFLSTANSPLEDLYTYKFQLYYLLANEYLYKKPQKSIVYCNKALEIVDHQNYTYLGMIYNVKASAYGSLSSYDSTLLYLDSALFATQKIEEDPEERKLAQIAAIYSNKATVSVQQQHYQEAAVLHYKALEIYDSIQFYRGQAGTFTNLSSISEYLKDFETAVDHAKKAVEIYSKTVDSSGLHNAYFNLGVMQGKNQQWEEALQAMEPAISFYKKNEYWEQLGLAYMNKGNYMNKLGQVKQAIFYNAKALALGQFFNSKESLLNLYLNQASLYLQEKKFKESLGLYQSLLDSIPTTSTITLNRLQALEGLEQSALGLGNFKAAYNYSQDRGLLQDSIEAINKAEVIRDLQVKYQTKEITQQNKALQKEKKYQQQLALQNRRLLYLAIGLGVLVALILLLLLQYNRVKSNYKTRELKYQLLRNQMNPHFLFNVLGAIQSFIYTNNPVKAGDFLSSFATLVRSILDNSSQEYIPISKEIDWLENYVALQALRFEEKLDYTITIDPLLKEQVFFIPPMLIQPVIENTLEHGFKDISYKGQLNITMTLLDGGVEIIIEDNGIGFDPTAPSSEEGHISHATRITKERIALLNKKSTEKITFHINSSPQQGTTVQFHLPFES